MQVLSDFFEVRDSSIAGKGLFKKMGVFVEGRVCRVRGLRETCEEPERQEEGIYKFDLSPRALSDTVLHRGELKRSSNAASNNNAHLEEYGARTLPIPVFPHLHQCLTCVLLRQCVCELLRSPA